MAPVGSWLLGRTLPRFVGPRKAWVLLGRAVQRGGGFQAPKQLLDTGLEDRAFRLGVGRELLEPPADVGLEVAGPRVESRHPLVALALERVRGLAQPPLEP